LGTELLQDEEHAERYLTIDQWNSKAEYEALQSEREREYQALDLDCEDLTEQESLLGRWAASND